MSPPRDRYKGPSRLPPKIPKRPVRGRVTQISASQALDIVRNRENSFSQRLGKIHQSKVLRIINKRDKKRHKSDKANEGYVQGQTRKYLASEAEKARVKAEEAQARLDASRSEASFMFSSVGGSGSSYGLSASGSSASMGASASYGASAGSTSLSVSEVSFSDSTVSASIDEETPKQKKEQEKSALRHLKFSFIQGDFKELADDLKGVLFDEDDLTTEDLSDDELANLANIINNFINTQALNPTITENILSFVLEKLEKELLEQHLNVINEGIKQGIREKIDPLPSPKVRGGKKKKRAPRIEF